MSLSLFGALVLATTVAETVENPRFTSPNGEMCVVVRRFPLIGDFESITSKEHFRRRESGGEFDEPLPEQSASETEPTRGALYRVWPSGYQERLAEFVCASAEERERVLVADDGVFVTYDAVWCGETAWLLTIRAADGSLVRALRVRDVMTSNDQHWLCRGDEDDVRFVLGDTLRMTMLVTGGRWDDADARHHTVDIDLRTGEAPAPKGDLCPAPWRVVAEADDRLPGRRSDPDVTVLASQALLDRAVVRIIPEYPIIATKARISGTVGAQVVVGTDGRVETVSIVKPLPFGMDEAVRVAVQQWQFAPAPTRVSGVLAFRFELIRTPRLQTTF
jgi:TonB family protein